MLDGDPSHTTTGNNTFNTVLTQMSAGWETATSLMTIDQPLGRVILHNVYTHSTSIIDALSNPLNVLATVLAPQNSSRPIALDATAHVAYLTLGVGGIQSIDVNTGAAQILQTGTETRVPVVDKTSHVAYVARTGADTGVAVIDSTGLKSTIVPPVAWVRSDSSSAMRRRTASTPKIHGQRGRRP